MSRTGTAEYMVKVRALEANRVALTRQTAAQAVNGRILSAVAIEALGLSPVEVAATIAAMRGAVIIGKGRNNGR